MSWSVSFLYIKNCKSVFCVNMFLGAIQMNSIGIDKGSMSFLRIQVLFYFIIPLFRGSKSFYIMEIEGKVIQLLPMQSGQGKNGTWRKQEFVIETGGNYPKKVVVALWGDKIDQANVRPGEEVVASIELESREFNNRWYTDVKAWKVVKKGSAGAPAADQNMEGMTFTEDEGDVLPF